MECGVGEEFMDRRLEGGAGTASREEGRKVNNKGEYKGKIRYYIGQIYKYINIKKSYLKI